MKSPIQLRHYLSLHFGMAVIIPAIAIAGLVYFFMVPDIRERTTVQHQALADCISGQVSAYLEGGERQIKALAAHLENRGVQPGPELTALLDGQCGNGAFFETLFIFNNAGAGIQTVGLSERRRPNRGDLIGLDLSGHSFIKGIKETRPKFLLQTFLSMVSNRPAVALATRLPNGFLIGEITLDKLSDFIRRLPAKSGFVTMLIDTEGIAVADPMKRHWGPILDFNFTAAGEKDLKKDNAIRAFELDGENMLGTLVNMDRIGWRVLVAQPARKVFEPLGKIFSLLAWGLAATLGLVLALSWLLAGRFAGLFTSYANNAESIAQGNYKLEWPRIKTKESVRMGKSLERMAEKISQREEALRFTQFTFDKAAMGIHYVRSDGRILKVNEQAARMLGYSADEMTQLFLSDIDPDIEPEFINSMWRKLMEDGVVIAETLHIRKDGSLVPVHIVSNYMEFEDRQYSICFVQDISERKQMEESLRLTQYIVDKAPIGIWRMGKDGEVLDVNEQGCASLGYIKEELCRMKVIDFDPNFDAAVWADNVASLKAAGTTTIESLHRRKNGEVFPIEVIQNRIRFEEQVFHLAFVQDITERKRREKELADERSRLASIIESAQVGTWEWNVQTGETVFNEIWAQIVGYTLEELAPISIETWASLAHPEDLKGSDELLNKHISGELPFYDYECRMRHKDGHWVWVHDQGRLMTRDADGAPLLMFGTHQDITERKRMEEMMIQSEKMLSVGGLAAGMAHEINNPLAGILQNASVLENRLLGDLPANQKAAEAAGTSLSAIRHYLELRKLPGMLTNICESGSRAAEIVKNMLSFARKSDRVISSQDLGALLDRTLELVRTDYDMKKQYDVKQIRIKREYDPAAPLVPCEASKLQQVFMNILKNGAEAMADGKDAPRPPGFALRVQDDGKWVRVEIEDNGPGMDDSTRRRIFEPFFTTKPVGKGTGLGLSVSYFIVAEDHGGEMHVRVVEGGGTCFVIRLPKGGGGR